MLPIITYIVGYRNPESNEVHFTIVNGKDLVIAINKARVRFPKTFELYSIEGLKRNTKNYKVQLLNKDKITIVEVEANNVDEAIEKAKNKQTYTTIKVE